MTNWANRTVVGLFFSGSGCMCELSSVGPHLGAASGGQVLPRAQGDLLSDGAEGRGTLSRRPGESKALSERRCP